VHSHHLFIPCRSDRIAEAAMIAAWLLRCKMNWFQSPIKFRGQCDQTDISLTRDLFHPRQWRVTAFVTSSLYSPSVRQIHTRFIQYPFTSETRSARQRFGEREDRGDSRVFHSFSIPCRWKTANFARKRIESKVESLEKSGYRKEREGNVSATMRLHWKSVLIDPTIAVWIEVPRQGSYRRLLSD
jgi:hypothetical protein